MKHATLFLALLGYCLVATAQDTPLLKKNVLHYKGEKITLDAHHLYIDGAANPASIHSPYVFTTFNEAIQHLQDGSADHPMTLYIAPYVYWIDNPDDPEVRVSSYGGTPYALEFKCNGLRLYGLSDKAEDVVLACNRGQTQGAVGNFTLFRIEGDDVSAENITFGNYCNVDLVYPRDPKLSRSKRMDAIVQAQLIHNKGDRYAFRNCRFISRLNLCPCNGGKRTLFDHCHFESTDDSLCGTAVYTYCQFVFFGSKPFYNTSKTGVALFHCDFDVRTQDVQYFTKVGSPLTVIDSRFHVASDSMFIGWTRDPAPYERNYQDRVTYNGRPYQMHPRASESWLTVDLAGKEALKAYVASLDGKEIDNVYNLLRGTDDWDPLHQKEMLRKAEQQNHTPYTNRPTLLKVMPEKAEIESGVTEVTLAADFRLFGDYPCPGESLRWYVDEPYAQEVKLLPSDGGRCRVIGTITDDVTKEIAVKVVSVSGLESASALTVRPKMLEAPDFQTLPSIEIVPSATGGFARVNYQIEWQGRADESLITWYRCTDASGRDAVEVAVSRLNIPEQRYVLSPGDVGYYLMASVQPKHLRCAPGTARKVITTRAIAASDWMTGCPSVKEKDFSTDFRNFPTATQHQLLPGFWTVDGYKPLDTQPFNWSAAMQGNWFYGKGLNNASFHHGLLQGQKGARLLYTPTGKDFGGMQLTLQVDPAKTAGQGFGSATGQYMDVCLKFDTHTLTGYGLRIIRTIHHDSAVDFYLVKYENGVVKPISKTVSSSCYLSTCTLTLTLKGDKLTARAKTDSKQGRPAKPGVEADVSLEASVQPNVYGGIAIQHTGSTGESATQLRHLQVHWD